MATDGAQESTPTQATRRQPGGPAKGDRRRQAIVDAVERLLREKTIAELSVENIAAAAGISRSGFYFYFESKYAALGDALSDVGEAISQVSEDFFGGSEDPPEVYVPRALADITELWHRHRPLMLAIETAAHTDAGVRALREEWLGGFAERIAERIEIERAEGRAPDGLPARELARALIAINQAVLYEDVRDDAPPAAREATVRLLSHVWLASVWARHVYGAP